MLSTAIVHVPAKPEPYVPATPFEGFMAELDRKYAASTTTTASAAVWTAFPYEQIVSEGLWLVFLRAAERLGVKLDTADVVLEDVAPRVNRVLNSGFGLVYKTIEDAATDFDRRVANAPLEEAVVACAKFFGELIRVSAEIFEKMRRRLARFNQKNQAYKSEDGKSVEYVRGPQVSLYELAGLLLEEPVRKPSRVVGEVATRSYLYARNDLRELKRLTVEIEHLRTLPLRLQSVPQIATPNTALVSYQWLNTQLLLAAIRAESDRDHLKGAEYHEAVHALASISDAEAIVAFRRRMRSRDRKIGINDLDFLDPVLADCLAELRRWDPERLNLHRKEGLFIDVTSGQTVIDDDIIVDIAKETGFHSLESIGGAAMVEKAVREYDWEKLKTFAVIKRQIDEGSFQFEDLVENLHRCIEPVRLEGIAYIMSHSGLDDSIAKRMFELGLIKPEGDLALRFASVLTPAQALEAWPSVVNWMANRRGGAASATETLYPFIERLRLNRKPAPKVRKTHGDPITSPPELRKDLRHLLRDCIYSVDEVFHDEAKRRASSVVRFLKSRMDKDFYYRLMLSCEVDQREKVYQFGTEGGWPYTPTWEMRILPTEEGDEINLDLNELLGTSGTQLLKLLRKYQEDDIFRWLYEADPDLEAKLAAYQKARKAYYKANRGP